MKVEYQVFRGMFSTWKTLFSQAAEFATDVGKEKVLSISHSQDNLEGVVVVWYWSEE